MELSVVSTDEEPRDYPPRLYPEGRSNLENKDINHNFKLGDIPGFRESIGQDVWDAMKGLPVGIVAKLADSGFVWSGKTVHYLLCRQLRVHKKEIWCVVGGEPIRFSLHEFGEITGLSTGPLPTERFEPDYKPFWKELGVPEGVGPKLDELRAALEVSRGWSFEKRKWLGLLYLQAVGIYSLHHNSRIPFESAIRVFDDEAMRAYPWGRTAFRVLVDSVKMLNPQGGSYTVCGFKDVLLAWAYEYVDCFGDRFGRVINEHEEIPLLRWGGNRTRSSLETVVSEEIRSHGFVRTSNMLRKESVEELFPEWPDEDADPQLDNLIRDLHAGRFVKGFWDVKRNVNKKKKMAILPQHCPRPAKKHKAKEVNKLEEVLSGEDDSAENDEEVKMKKAEAAGERLGIRDMAIGQFYKLLEKVHERFDGVESRISSSESNVLNVVKEMEMSICEKIEERMDAKYLPMIEGVESRVEARFAAMVVDMKELKERLDSLGSRAKAQNAEQSKLNYAVSGTTPKKVIDLDNDTTSGAVQELSRKLFPDFDNAAEDTAEVTKGRAADGEDMEKEANKETGAADGEDKENEAHKETGADVSPAKEKALGVEVIKETAPGGEVNKKKKAPAVDAAIDFISVSPAKPVNAGNVAQTDNAAKEEAKDAKTTPRRKNAKAAAVNTTAEDVVEVEKSKDDEADENENGGRGRCRGRGRVGGKGGARGVARGRGGRTGRGPAGGAKTQKKKDVNNKGREKENDVEDDDEVESVNFGPEILAESDLEEDERLRSELVRSHRSASVQLAADGSALKPSQPRPQAGGFPYIGTSGETCMRKDLLPSPGIYDPLEPVDPAKVERLLAYLNPPKGSARIPEEEKVQFYDVLMTERAHWSKDDHGWLHDTHMAAYLLLLRERLDRDPCPFYTRRIAFIDAWYTGLWARDYEQFKMNPKMFNFRDNMYDHIVNGLAPSENPTNMKWLVDVDHLYITHNTRNSHWVTLHVDLRKEKIDCYDCILGEATKESDDNMLEQCRPFTHMIPAMMNVLVPHDLRKPSFKQFAFRRRKGKNIPQNDQVGDCGVYALKFAECLALGVTFDGICDANIQGLRIKMAAEIFDEAGDFLRRFNEP